MSEADSGWPRICTGAIAEQTLERPLDELLQMRNRPIALLNQRRDGEIGSEPDQTQQDKEDRKRDRDSRRPKRLRQPVDQRSEHEGGHRREDERQQHDVDEIEEDDDREGDEQNGDHVDRLGGAVLRLRLAGLFHGIRG